MEICGIPRLPGIWRNPNNPHFPKQSSNPTLDRKKIRLTVVVISLHRCGNLIFWKHDGANHAGCNMPPNYIACQRKQKGAAAVELAVSLPVLALLLFGTIEACTMIFLQQSLEIAAYEGARVAILPKVQLSDVEATVNEILTGRRVNGGRVTITLLQYSDQEGKWVNVNQPNFQEVAYGTFIKVDVAAMCSRNAVFNLRFFGNQEMTGSAAFMKEF